MKNCRHIIVTGGSKGIGFAIAKTFVEQGDAVLIIARDEKSLNHAAEQLEHAAGTISTFQCDVSDHAQVKKIEPIIERRFNGTVDVLVNAAGIYGPKGQLTDNDSKLWEQTFRVNVFGTMYMDQLIIPYIKQNGGGSIIHFSGGGEGAFPNFTAYASSKGAILRFTESLAAELQPHHITVNAIAPGAVNTGLLEEVLEAGEEKVGHDFYVRSQKQKQEGGVSPQRAAELALLLASNECRVITGKLVSAVHDNHEVLIHHAHDIASSDIYTMRRVKPKDRGYDW